MVKKKKSPVLFLPRNVSEVSVVSVCVFLDRILRTHISENRWHCTVAALLSSPFCRQCLHQSPCGSAVEVNHTLWSISVEMPPSLPPHLVPKQVYLASWLVVTTCYWNTLFFPPAAGFSWCNCGRNISPLFIFYYYHRTSCFRITAVVLLKRLSSWTVKS